MKPNAIVTLPPYAPYAKEVLQHPLVSGIRLNTVMPVKESLDELLTRLGDVAGNEGKQLWIDLKGRQLRIKSYGVPPFTEIELTHNIEVQTPCSVYFSDRQTKATLLGVNKNKLIMQEGPRRVVGPGESVTIPHPSLKIEGNLTETDKAYIEAAKRTGIHNYMLSFVESKEDISQLRALDKEARIIAKIESQRGAKYVKNEYSQEARLMAARGDLYLEIHWPHEIPRIMQSIIEKDKNAIAASRILDSLAQSPEPSCADIGDADNLLRMGYRTLMLGDEVCLRREPLISSLNLLAALAEPYNENRTST